jgi:Mrp family chromosome partitioning ATPase
MSRNFELLQRLGFDEAAISVGAAAEPPLRVTAVPQVVQGTALPPCDPYVSNIVQRLFLAGDGTAPTALSFISLASESGDTVCARVAQSLAAQVKADVCAVDADFEHPALHQYFQLPNTGGLAAALHDAAPVGAFASRIAGTQLTVMPAGSRGGWDAAGAAAVADRIRELRAQFEYVLVRAPLSSAVFLGRLTGKAVLVIEAHATRRDAAAQMKLHLEQSGVEILGAVLNNRTFPIPQSLYSKLF